MIGSLGVRSHHAIHSQSVFYGRHIACHVRHTVSTGAVFHVERTGDASTCTGNAAVTGGEQLADDDVVLDAGASESEKAGRTTALAWAGNGCRGSGRVAARSGNPPTVAERLRPDGCGLRGIWIKVKWEWNRAFRFV